MRGQEALLPHWIVQLVRLCAILGPDNVFVSLVESGTDKEDTPALVQLAALILDALGVPHLTVTTGQRREDGDGRIEFLAKVRGMAGASRGR